jgi:outer membrane biosynthesis protein TonB
LPDIAANAPKLGEQVEQFLEENLNYPPSLLNNKVSGQVTLKMDVNQETGSIGSIIVSSSPNDLMSKEVIRVLKLIPEALLIGSTNGMVKRQVNITFNLK